MQRFVPEARIWRSSICMLALLLAGWINNLLWRDVHGWLVAHTHTAYACALEAAEETACTPASWLLSAVVQQALAVPFCAFPTCSLSCAVLPRALVYLTKCRCSALVVLPCEVLICSMLCSGTSFFACCLPFQCGYAHPQLTHTHMPIMVVGVTVLWALTPSPSTYARGSPAALDTRSLRMPMTSFTMSPGGCSQGCVCKVLVSLILYFTQAVQVVQLPEAVQPLYCCNAATHA